MILKSIIIDVKVPLMILKSSLKKFEFNDCQSIFILEQKGSCFLFSFTILLFAVATDLNHIHLKTNCFFLKYSSPVVLLPY
jgi:uncharacterized membrane protein